MNKKENIEKLNVKEVLRGGYLIICKYPVLLLLGLFARLPSLFFQQALPDVYVVWGAIIVSLVNLYIGGLITRFIYESIEKQPSWSRINNFVLSKYFLLLAAFFIYLLSMYVGMVFLVIPGVFLAIKLFFYDCAILLDQDSVVDSLKRSWRITKENWWRLFFLHLIFVSLYFLTAFLEKLFFGRLFSLFIFVLQSVIFVDFAAVSVLAYLYLRKRENKLNF